MTTPAERVVVALGSNLGNRQSILAGAVTALADLVNVTNVVCSPAYESAAVKLHGVDNDAPRYLNAVATLDYAGDPYDLLTAINAIEAEHGRVRAERWGDRTLDIDLIVFGALTLTDPRLTVPHPRAAERDFVLAPWLDLDSEAVIPGKGKVQDLLAATGNTVHRVADAALLAPYPGDAR